MKNLSARLPPGTQPSRGAPRLENPPGFPRCVTPREGHVANEIHHCRFFNGLLAVLLFCAASGAGMARADGPFEGQWREGPMNIRVQVVSWGGDCGPRPRSTTTRGGGTFNITQSGDHLTFHLRRNRTTRGCWSENRAVRRVSSSHQAGAWTVVCRTPAEDSRAETGRYRIQSVGGDRLTFTDNSEYDWQLNTSRCQARITTTQAFTRVGGPSATTEEPTESRPPRCTPGAPARIALRPNRADVQPGGEQCFTTRVVDAQGCPVRRRTALTLADGSPGSLSELCFHAPNEAGTARVVATSGDLSAEAAITIRTMDLSDLIARRTETGSVGSGAPEADASSQTAARVSAHETESEPDLLVPGLAVAAALLLLVFGIVVLAVRSKKPRAPVDRGIPASREFGRTEPAATMPDAAPEHVPEHVPENGAPESPSPPGEDLICPACRRGYPPGTAECAHDQSALVAYKDFVATERENICPTCGERYPETVTFCGKDGSTLNPDA